MRGSRLNTLRYGHTVALFAIGPSARGAYAFTFTAGAGPIGPLADPHRSGAR
jgi:hypothetical protein